MVLQLYGRVSCTRGVLEIDQYDVISAGKVCPLCE